MDAKFSSIKSAIKTLFRVGKNDVSKITISLVSIKRSL